MVTTGDTLIMSEHEHVPNKLRFLRWLSSVWWLPRTTFDLDVPIGADIRLPCLNRSTSVHSNMLAHKIKKILLFTHPEHVSSIDRHRLYKLTISISIKQYETKQTTGSQKIPPVIPHPPPPTKTMKTFPFSCTADPTLLLLFF